LIIEKFSEVAMAFQVSVFAENKPGKIERITGVLADKRINIRAITISDSGDYGIVKLLLDQPEAGCEVLKEAGIAASLKEIVGVRMKDTPGGLHKIAAALADSGINVEDAYGFIVKSQEEAVFVFQVENPMKAEKILVGKGFTMLGENELYLL
jgi:hypothetical protein